MRSALPCASGVAFALAVPALAACSSASGGTLQIVGEADLFSRDPQPTQLTIDAVDSAGGVQTLATATLPVSSVDLGMVDVNTTATVTVTGTDAAGARILFGESIPIALGSLAGTTLPLFVQRTGELSRLPNPLSDARPTPTLAVFDGRYLFVGGGGDSSLAAQSQIYDFGALSPLGAPPPLPRAPRSVVFFGEVAWFIDDAGASKYDFSAPSATADVVPPAGGSLADVAGGATVFADDGSQYVVGATRTTGAPTSTVLAVDASGAASFLFLGAARLGAAAAWVTGRGLVVCGGSATAAGAEIVGVGATTGSALAYPPDPTAGAGGAKLDGQHVLVAGGTNEAGESAGVRTIDVGCSAACAPAAWAPLPATLTEAQVFASDSTHALVVGDTADGQTQVVQVSAAAATPVATRVVHHGARAVVSPLGSVVLFGGAGEIEAFIP